VTGPVSAITLLALAALFGGMLAFTGMFAPLVFIKLPPATAGSFIRAIFPWYYLYVLLLSALGAVGIAATHGLVHEVVLMGLVAVGAIYARWGLIPAINRLRDRELAGDPAAASRFKQRHRLSVIINGAQLVVVGYVLLAYVA